MDDKVNVLDLYEKMNYISIELGSLKEMVELLNEDLKKNIVVDNKVYCGSNVSKNIDSTNKILNSVKYDVLKDLKDYL